jgi:hypothetical protein
MSKGKATASTGISQFQKGAASAMQAKKTNSKSGAQTTSEHNTTG